MIKPKNIIWMSTHYNWSSQLILERKYKYYVKLAMKLNNPKTSSKTYWSVLKTTL